LAGARRAQAAKPGRTLAFYAAILITIAVVGGIIYFFYSDIIANNVPGVYQSTFEMSIVIGNPVNTTEHNSTIPADIGVSGGYWHFHNLDQYGIDGRAPMYTLDTTGLIRIQSNVARNYTLGDLFLIWGVTFNDQCIQPTYGGQTYCQNAKQYMFVDLYDNGQPIANDYQGFVPLGNDVIRIAYEPVFS
jgi:hypothetical protein